MAALRKHKLQSKQIRVENYSSIPFPASTFPLISSSHLPLDQQDGMDDEGDSLVLAGQLVWALV